MDESVGWAREQVFGPAGEIQDVAQSGPERSAMKRKAGWRKGEVKWEDGGVAGGLMGLVVGTACEYIYPSIFLAHYQYLTMHIDKLPRPLFIRSLIMGIALGSLTSGMQTMQARIGRMREEEERKAKLTDNEQLSSPTAAAAAAAAATSALVTEEVAPVMSLSEETKPTEEIIVDRIPGEEEPRSWWESVKSWVGA